jgi:hypothetical protein
MLRKYFRQYKELISDKRRVNELLEYEQIIKNLCKTYNCQPEHHENTIDHTKVKYIAVNNQSCCATFGLFGLQD